MADPSPPRSATARPTLALYVTGHGYGHAVRSAEVARALLARGASVLVRTDAPAWLFPPGVRHLPSPGSWSVDVGVVQRDGLDMDIPATLARWTDFAQRFDEYAASEAALLRREHADVLLGDVPPLAFAAAARADIPSLALGNFTWDWIYAEWPGFDPIVSRIASAYAAATLLLRLPLHPPGSEPFRAFRRIEDVPLIARHASRERLHVRASLGVSDTACLVLLSFGGFDTEQIDLQRLGDWPRFTFVVTPREEGRPSNTPANVMTLPRDQLDYVSLLAACDAVVTKPGYGIVADCLVNHVPVLYTDRGPFREYPVLAAALEQFGPARFVSRTDVRRGHLGPPLESLGKLAAERGWQPLATLGAEVVAERVLRTWEQAATVR